MDSEFLQAAVGSAIRDLRISNELSQEDLAEMAGLHRTYIGSVERGERNVSLQNLHRIAVSLGQKTSALLKLAEKAMEKELQAGHKQ